MPVVDFFNLTNSQTTIAQVTQYTPPSGGRCVLSHLRDGGLRVCQIEEIDDGHKAPAVLEDKLTGESQVQLVHAGQAQDPCWLKNDGLTDRDALTVWHGKSLRWLEGETGIVLKVDAGSEFPG